MLYAGKVEQDKSLQKLIKDQQCSIENNKPVIWLIGNSGLEFSVDDEKLTKFVGLPCVKLCHGGATVRGSAAMLDYYLRHASTMPEYLILFMTKDDVNPNGLGAQTSGKYLEFITWRRYLYRYSSSLRSIRGAIGSKIIHAWALLFVAQEHRVPFLEKYDGVKLPPIDQKAITRGMMKDYAFDEGGFYLLSQVCRRYRVKHVAVVVLPVAEAYRMWHNRIFPEITYEEIRKKIKTVCALLGFTVMDLGDPLPDDMFSDMFHVNTKGCVHITDQLSQRLLKLTQKTS
jgi:hypothetical protein